MTPTLNWKELAHLVSRLRPQLENRFVDRVIVPERPRFPSGYLKGEWAIRLTGTRQEATLLFSVRPRHPYLALLEGKGPRAATDGTHSAFDLSLAKALRGAKLSSIETLPEERIAVLWFTDRAKAGPRLGLVLVLIPAVPEAILVQADQEQPPWKVIARTRATGPELFMPPDHAGAPRNIEIRHDLTDSPDAFAKELEKGLEAEAFEIRLQAAKRAVQDLIKRAKDRLGDSRRALEEAGREPDWKRYGDLLKPWIASPPPIENGKRRVMDYSSGEIAEIPSDPKLGARAQVDKFYQLARRKNRREEEARSRLQGFQSSVSDWERLLAAPPGAFDWEALKKFEGAARIAPRTGGGAKAGKKGISWLGKSFLSRDGLAIHIGRNRAENLELTFKHARGNDLWMHVRGRPGAHALIPLSSGKSAPLETLLDAAALTVYYSGGEKWGKTEVDYTFKKYVKRIKDSSEASYTHNKTLIIEPDESRLERLLSQGGS